MMDIKSSTPYTDMSKAAKKLADAHAGVRAAIEQHAEQHANDRLAAHAQLAADNKLRDAIA